MIDDVQRRFQYRITAPMFEHHRGTIDVIDLADDDVPRRVHHRGRPAHDGAHHRRRHGRCARRTEAPDGSRTTRKERTDGPQDPVRHHRPAALRHLGCNGGTVARTPVIDALAAQGIRYERAQPQSRGVHAVAQHDDHRPARQHARRVDERRAAARRRAVGGRGAARRRLPHGDHRQAALRAVPRPVRCASPRTASPASRWSGTHRGLRALRGGHPRRAGPARTTPAGWPPTTPRPSACSTRCSTASLEVNALGGGDTGAPQVWENAIPKEWYHTDWVADRTISLARLARRRRRLVLLDELPRPAPPVGPADERARPHRLARRAAARRLHRGPRPSARPCSTPSRATGGPGTTARWSATTRRPLDWVPATLTADQVREVNPRNAVECELIDEALGRVLGRHRAPGAGPTTSTSCSPPTTASSRATSACCSRGRTTSTG